MDLPPGPKTSKLRWLFLILIIATIAFIIWMRNYLAPLQSGEVIRYEMAKSPEVAASMISQWKLDGKYGIVIKSIYIDYFFILLYTATIAVSCTFLSSLTKNLILRKAGKFFSVFIFAAGIFDVVENIAMMRSLHQDLSISNVSLAYKMAISKFTIVLMAVFFIAACFISWLSGLVPVKEKFWKSR